MTQVGAGKSQVLEVDHHSIPALHSAREVFRGSDGVSSRHSDYVRLAQELVEGELAKSLRILGQSDPARNCSSSTSSPDFRQWQGRGLANAE